MRQRDDIWLKELDIADVMPIVDSILEQDDQVMVKYRFLFCGAKRNFADFLCKFR